MQYMLEVENSKKDIATLKKELLLGYLRFNISDFKGNYYYFGLGNCKCKKYYLFNVPESIQSVAPYLKNNIDIIELRPTFIENSIIDLKTKFRLFNDVYKTDDFVLSSSDDETVFYLRNISNRKLTSVDYRTVINVLRDYYADLWGLDLDCGDYSIIYLFTLDHKFCKILIEPNMHLGVEKAKNDKALKLINSKN